MADLPPAALQFLQTHLNFDQRGYLAKRSLRKDMEKFWRRREKALAEFAVLPPDHARKDEFDKAINDATTMAENGDLKGAYKALDDVKLQARAEANTVKNGLDLNTVLVDLAALETKVGAILPIAQDEYAELDRVASNLELLVTWVKPVSDATTYDEAVQLYGSGVASRTEFRGKLTNLKAQAARCHAAYAAEFTGAPDTKKTVERMMHNLALLRSEGKALGDVDGRVLTVTKNIAELGLEKSVSDFKSKLDQRVNDATKVVEDAFAAVLTQPQGEMSTSTSHDGTRLTPEEEAQSLGAKFEKLEKRDAERLAAVRKRLSEEAGWDFILDLNAFDAPAIAPSRVDEFDTSDAISPTELGFDPRDLTVADDVFATAAATSLDTKMTADLTTYLDPANAGTLKVPDTILEVGSRTFEGWCQEVAKSFGLVWDKKNLSPDFVSKIEAGAKAMQAKAIEKYPDKAAADMSSFTMGGVVFDDVKKLGAGGGGEVFLATAADGRKVVIKRPLDLEDATPDMIDPMIDEMRTELLAHRAITGGENGVCHDNLLEHQGMVLSAEGVPLPVMDLADAGDAEEYGFAMASLANTGLISEPARQAMMAVQMRDVIQGVKAMHDQGFAHFDLKQLNVFMTKDGTYKVADFGLAQEADSRDDVLKDGFLSTDEFMAPEISTETDLTMSGDMFSLGAMLQMTMARTQDKHTQREGWGSYNAGPAASQELDDDDGIKDIEVSASTRLISKLMSPDPDERPSLETVLQSTYFSEIDEGHSPEQIDKLRKATANYAATVGRETKDLEFKERNYTALIVRNQRILTHEATRDLIKNGELFLKQQPDVIERLEKTRDSLPPPTNDLEIIVKKSWDSKVDEAKERLVTTQENLVRYRKKLSEPVSDRDIKKARAEIEKNEALLASVKAKIKAIREDPKYAAIMLELKDANAAFR